MEEAQRIILGIDREIGGSEGKQQAQSQSEGAEASHGCR